MGALQILKMPKPEPIMGVGIDIRQAFEEIPPPLDFVLPGLLAGTVGAIISPGGAGKSMIALELSILVATGFDISGFGQDEIRHTGKVAFLAAEDPADAIRHRLHAIGKYLDPDLRERVHEDIEIEALCGTPIEIMQSESLAMIESFATNRRLLFLDTLRRFHGLDENSSSEMAMLMSILEGVVKRTSCTILFLHHASKAAAMGGMGDMQQASRGSSVLTDNVRWQMYLSTCTKAEAEGLEIDESMRKYFVRAGISKQNYGLPAADIWLRRAEGGVLVPAEFPTSAATAKKKGRKNDKEI